MSMLNSMFYNVADRIINPDNTDNMKETLSNLVRGSLGFGKDSTLDDDYADDGSLIGDGSDVLSEIRDNDAKYNDNLMSLFPTEFDEFSEANAEANGSLLDGMRMSTFKVELINAELDIVDPMQLAFRNMFLGLREDNLMFQHENSQWFEKIVQGLDRLDRSSERNAIGIVLAYKQFMRHPVWYTLSAVANLVVDLGKMVASSGFKLLFGFGNKKTVDEKILEETKKQTEFMLTGEIDQTKNLWEQFKSGGVAGLIGRHVGDRLGITQSEAQKRADARLQGEEVAGGIAGFLTDKIFGSEIVRRERLDQKKDEPSPCCLNTNKLLKQMKSISEKEYEEAIEFLESIGDNTKDTAKESKKTNRHLLMSKMMGILTSVGSFFKGLGGVGGILTKGIGAGIIAKMLYSSWDKLKSGEGIGITNTLSAVIGGLMVGGIKGAAVGGAFAVGTEIGNFLNDNIINPASEWLTGKEGETLGTAIYDFFNGTKDKIMTMTRDDLEEEKKKREDANWAQKKLGIGVMSEDEIAQAEERIRGEERLLAGAKRKAEAKDAAMTSSYNSVEEVDTAITDIDSKIAGLQQVIPNLVSQGQHETAKKYSSELASLSSQKEQLGKVKTGLEAMGGSKPTASIGAPPKSGSSVSIGYSDFQRSQDELEVQEAIARQQQNIEYTKNREQIGQMRTGGFAAAQADYNRKMGISNNPETINRPSIDTSTVKPATPISIDPMVAEQAAMNRKMDRMIKQLEEANKPAPTSAPFDPYPDNKTILNASGGF